MCHVVVQVLKEQTQRLKDGWIKWSVWQAIFLIQTASTESFQQDHYDNTNTGRFRGCVGKKHNQNVGIEYEANTERGQIKNTQICEPSM